MPDLAGADSPPRGLDPGDPVAVPQEAGDFAVLHDVDAEPVCRPGIAPDDRVVARGAAAALQQAALDREPRIVEIEERQHGPHLLPVEQLGIDAVKPHGVAAAGIGVTLRVGVVEVEDAALADHRVVVQVLLQPLPQLHRPFVEGDVAGKQVVGADDRGVAAGIARSDPAFLQHRDVADAVLLGEIVGGRQPMPAAADDHDVVGGLGRGVAPGRLPELLAREGVGQDGKERVMHGPLDVAKFSRRVSRRLSNRAYCRSPTG